ncbi:hypothetical protein FBU30_006675 [Linnemannia zychae]|nr:hypothetical protein FBU30_006675 [Linnemannia zychae]
MDERLTALEASSRRLASVDFTAPRLYSSLLLENQAVPIRNAKAFEQNLYHNSRIDTLRNMLTREGVDEFETTMELATALNEICQNKAIEERLSEVASAHVDVLESINQLSATLSELQEANESEDIQESPRQEGDEIMTDIMREEGEIFALEQMLSEKRQLLSSMQKELDGMADIPAEEFMDHDHDDQTEVSDEEMNEESDIVSKKQEDGNAKVNVEGIKEAYHRLVRLLDGIARCQRHIVNMDILQQISSNIIDGCADPAASEFDPPSTISVILAARTLQVIRESGGTIPLQDLKDHISKEAIEHGSAETLGVQAVYGLVASHLIHIDRSQKTNMVSLA